MSLEIRVSNPFQRLILQQGQGSAPIKHRPPNNGSYQHPNQIKPPKERKSKEWKGDGLVIAVSDSMSAAIRATYAYHKCEERSCIFGPCKLKDNEHCRFQDNVIHLGSKPWISEDENWYGYHYGLASGI